MTNWIKNVLSTKAHFFFAVASLAMHMSPALAEDKKLRMLFADRIETLGKPLAGKWKQLVENNSWYGIYCTGKSCSVKATVVAAKVVSTLDCSGKRVEGSLLTFTPKGPLFVVNKRWRRENSVDTLLVEGDGQEVPSGDRAGGLIAKSQARDIRLVIPTSPISNDFCALKEPIAIELVDGKSLQSRWARNVCADPMGMAGEFRIHWAGDLDGDGRWDVLVSYPQGPYSLLLSNNPERQINSSFKLVAEGC